MPTLKLEIVTPEEKIYSEDVDMVTLPGAEGELGVYPKHVPVLTTLKPGELRVLKDGRETALAVGEGFVEIKTDGVSVLTDMALESAKIDLEAAEKAVARAQAAMKEDHTAEEVAAIQASLQKALAQMHVKRRHHHG
ncbi:MAG TPA: F0F1 ATP synthase subunit epsilon [Chthoniobacterales bacterium]|nr:F0F1 ATP synthase subunit epsilon [Chthoniobacterales bacterium]